MRTTFRRTAMATALAAGAGAVLSLASPLPVSAAPNSKADKEALAFVRDATAEYRDVAVADGYRPTEHCAESPDGGMGLHYVNPALFGSIDPAKPHILLYRKVGSQVQLIGVEYFKPDADQDLSTSGDRPSLFGHPFDGPMPGHEPGMPVHYDLHVWAWHSNPAGDFAIWNPSLHC